MERHGCAARNGNFGQWARVAGRKFLRRLVLRRHEQQHQPDTGWRNLGVDTALSSRIHDQRSGLQLQSAVIDNTNHYHLHKARRQRQPDFDTFDNSHPENLLQLCCRSANITVTPASAPTTPVNAGVTSANVTLIGTDGATDSTQNSAIREGATIALPASPGLSSSTSNSLAGSDLITVPLILQSGSPTTKYSCQCTNGSCSTYTLSNAENVCP